MPTGSGCIGSVVIPWFIDSNVMSNTWASLPFLDIPPTAGFIIFCRLSLSVCHSDNKHIQSGWNYGTQGYIKRREAKVEESTVSNWEMTNIFSCLWDRDGGNRNRQS